MKYPVSRMMAQSRPAEITSNDYVHKTHSECAVEKEILYANVVYKDGNEFPTALTREMYIVRRTSQRNLMSIKNK